MRYRFRSESHLLLAGLGVALACGPVAPVAEAAPGKDCVRVEVSAERDGPKAGRFFASEIEDLHLRVVFRKKRVFQPGETVELAFYLPEGHLYKRLTVPVSEPGRPELERPVAGHPFAVPAQQVGWDPSIERPVVEVPPLPVAGTHITQHSLYGQWLVEAWPQGAQVPCRAKFRLEP